MNVNIGSPYVITISRQFGCGGSFIGKILSSQLNILYMDREILAKVAEKLDTEVENIESRDEKSQNSLFWIPIMNTSYGEFELYTPPQINIPSDYTIYNAEAEIIKKTVAEKSAIIIGRGGFHILKDHPRHLSVFLFADIEYRQKRVEEIYKLSPKEALKLIEETDKTRERYIKSLIDLDMKDARNYNISLDTGILGLECTKKVILECVKERFEK